MSRTPLKLDEKSLTAATMRLLDRRGFVYADTPEEGQDAYDITMEAREEARLVLESYLCETAPLPSETSDLLGRLRNLAFGGRLGVWQESEDARLVIDALQALQVAEHREKARRLDPLPLSELSALVEDKLKLLSGLYSKTRRDWVLEVSHTLTEPTCPTAIIAPEDSNALRYAVHRDTVVEAIMAAADLAYREQVLGEAIRSESPVTNPDDRKWTITPEGSVALKD